jgi:hypothetical protein
VSEDSSDDDEVARPCGAYEWPRNNYAGRTPQPGPRPIIPRERPEMTSPSSSPVSLTPEQARMELRTYSPGSTPGRYSRSPLAGL